MLIFGAALVFMMVFRPQGLIGNPRRKFELRPDESGRPADSERGRTGGVVHGAS
jgi:hypothetical protein